MSQRYQHRKEMARMEAQEWQRDFDNHNYSYGELAAWQEHFARQARRYGLVAEFRENGIC